MAYAFLGLWSIMCNRNDGKTCSSNNALSFIDVQRCISECLDKRSSLDHVSSLVGGTIELRLFSDLEDIPRY